MTGALVQKFDVFAQLIAHGSIAGCARELGLPAASVIAAMNVLEDRMGFPLFTVVDGGVELTGDGRNVAHALAQLSIEEQMHWAEAIAHDDAKGMALPLAAKADIEPADEDDAEPERIEERRAIRLVEPAEVITTLPVEDEEEDSGPRHFRPQKIARATGQQPPPAEPEAEEQGRTITLAAHPPIFSHFQEALVAFEEASPDIGISLRLTGLDETDVAGLFHERLADIAYFYALEEPQGLPSRYAWSERISLFVGRGHPLSGLDMVTTGDLSSLSYVALAPGNVARRIAERALDASGLSIGHARSEEHTSELQSH